MSNTPMSDIADLYLRTLAENKELRAALADLVEQLEGVGIAHKECDEGQWSGAEGLSFAKARTALGEVEGE